MRPLLSLYAPTLPKGFPNHLLLPENVAHAEALGKKLRDCRDPNLPPISALNVLLAIAGLGEEGLGAPEASFARLLHAWVCHILAHPQSPSEGEDACLLHALRARLCVPYELLDHYDRARFAYDARDYIRIQGLLHPNLRRLLEDRTHRILFTGLYTFSLPKENPTDAILLHLDSAAIDFTVKVKPYGLNLAAIGPYAFFCMDDLAELCIPATVREIDEHAFSQCYDLQRIVLPENEGESKGQGITLHARAFEDCESLLEVPALNLPKVPALNKEETKGETVKDLLGKWNCPRLFDHPPSDNPDAQTFPNPFFWLNWLNAESERLPIGLDEANDNDDNVLTVKALSDEKEHKYKPNKGDLSEI